MDKVRSAQARRGRCEHALYKFSVRLTQIKDASALQQYIVEGIAKAVGASSGALALYVPAEETLSIVASYGYPAELVAHVRVKPGEGVFGRVFASGRAIHQADQVSGPGTNRRRYRTPSFLAVPLRGPDGIFGVVSVTDHVEGRSFVRGELAILRTFAIPAALALARERMRGHLSDAAHLASVDPLTGVFNRRRFDDRLEQEIQRHRRGSGDLALLMVDIDDFKQLNDSYGHLYGDRILREIVEIMRQSVRIFDVVARFGGEEFAILMPGANASTATQVAERIRRNTESHFSGPGRMVFASGAIKPTLSIGASTATSGASGEVLIAEADAALLAAKAAGKNTVRLYAPAVDRTPPTRGIR